jgi:hypothetical protein
MKIHATHFGFSLILLSAIPTFSQADDSTAETTAATVANVYVQTPKGVDVFSAASTGNLTLVKGSPFSDSGQMEGVSGKYLISVGTDYLHTYPIESNGTVGKQASETNTQDYGGSECGSTSLDGVPSGAFLDQAGQYFYVQLYQLNGGDSPGDCAAWQTYKVETNGTLQFIGSMEYEGWSDAYATDSSAPTVSSNDEYAYGAFYNFDGASYYTFSAFSRSDSGFLEINQNFTAIDPPANPNAPYGSWTFKPLFTQADNASHLAVLMESYYLDENLDQYYGPNQLASYTIDDASGGIASTNTWQNMPAPLVTNSVTMSMSTSGKLLAVFGYPGLQLFHFNGAAPITSYSSVLLPTTDIDQVAWDKDNHMYALSYESQKLYVFTVTPTTINEVAGSPYSVTGAYGIHGLIVVPK